MTEIGLQRMPQCSCAGYRLIFLDVDTTTELLAQLLRVDIGLQRFQRGWFEVHSEFQHGRRATGTLFGRLRAGDECARTVMVELPQGRIPLDGFRDWAHRDQVGVATQAVLDDRE
ncbi:hypothetical protein A5728_10250 [Kocuria sp. ICS0012]|nr:hypothetical protein A5728_10250 [Kocuria sp. ICS0012]